MKSNWKQQLNKEKLEEAGKALCEPALKRSFKGHKEGVLTTRFNPNLRQVVSGSADGTVMVWNFKPHIRPFRFVGHKGAVHTVAVSPSGQTIISGSADQTVKIWNNSVEGYSQTIKSHSAPVRTVALNQDGSLLLSGSDDKTLKVFQLHDRKFMFSISAHSNWIKSAQFSPDTRLIASASEDHLVKLWDVTTKGNIGTFSDFDESVNSVKFHPDGTCVAAGSHNNRIKIWDIRSQRLIQHYDAHSGPVNEISFHANGRYLLSASTDSTIKVWDLRQGYIMYTLYGHEGPATTADFSPSGDYFCTSGNDSVVMVWESHLNEENVELIDDFGTKTQHSLGKQTKPAVGGPTESRSVAQTQHRMTAAPVSRAQASVSKASPHKPETSKISKRSEMAAVGGLSPKGNQQKQGQVYHYQVPANQIQAEGGVAGSGEELATTLEKIVSQLSIISGTLEVLEQRVSMNENAVNTVLRTFEEEKFQREKSAAQIVHYNSQNLVAEQMHQRATLEQLRDLTTNAQNVLTEDDQEPFRVGRGFSLPREQVVEANVANEGTRMAKTMDSEEDQFLSDFKRE